MLAQWFVGTHNHQRALQVGLSPLKELRRSAAELPDHDRTGAARFVGLFDDFKLLLRGLAPAALNAIHHFHPSGR
jgi:hypothetical protein